MANNTHIGRVTSYNQVFDDVTLAYVPMVQPSTGGGGAGSTQVAVSSGSITVARVLDSSNAAVGVADSANNALRVNIVAGSASSTQVAVSSVAGTVTVTGTLRSTNSVAADLLATVTPSAGSTWAVRPLQSSAADLQVTATPAAGSTWAVRPLQSSAADLQMTATPAAGSTWAVRPLQSSAADLQMTATPAAGSTWAVRPLQSSRADLLVTAYQSSAAEFLVTATLGGNLQSTVTSNSGSSGINVRIIDGPSSAANFKTQSWTFDSTGGGVIGSTKGVTFGVNGLQVRSVAIDSTATGLQLATAGDNTILSSAATSIYVYAFSLTPSLPSTTSPTAGSSAVRLRLQSGTTGATAWQLTYQASTGTTPPIALAVTPPQFLFKTAAGALLNCNATSTGAALSVAAWRE